MTKLLAIQQRDPKVPYEALSLKEKDVRWLLEVLTQAKPILEYLAEQDCESFGCWDDMDRHGAAECIPGLARNVLEELERE